MLHLIEGSPEVQEVPRLCLLLILELPSSLHELLSWTVAGHWQQFRHHTKTDPPKVLQVLPRSWRRKPSQEAPSRLPLKTPWPALGECLGWDSVHEDWLRLVGNDLWGLGRLSFPEASHVEKWIPEQNWDSVKKQKSGRWNFCGHSDVHYMLYFIFCWFVKLLKVQFSHKTMYKCK